MSEALLVLDQIHSYYGASHILQDVSLQVPEGGAVSLMGRNGAGKTTTLKAIIGVHPARGGRILFAGHDITRLPPYRIARLGVAYVPETRDIFPSLTVLENLTLAARPGHWDLAAVLDLFPRLRERGRSGGGTLSGGEQQMLAIARALLMNPRLLLLDEPTEGLAPTIIDEIANVLATLCRAGMAILLVEQNYDFATALTESIFVLGKGRIRWHGPPTALAQAEELQRAWLGV